MIFTVKTLYNKGKSQRSIATQLGISRRTVKKYISQFSSKEIVTPKIMKRKKLDDFKEDISNWLDQGLTGVLIQENLLKEKQLGVGYATVSRYLKQFKTPETYIPLLAKPGEEAQVDFGYLGRFILNGKLVKTWCFSIVLSHSRYSFHCLVTDQSVATFVDCHIKAFEYFGGVPETVKIDNLKAGVITPNFYEPIIQTQYADFLSYYQSNPITARIRRGQDKGKVEAGVKYVKLNFLKRVQHNDFKTLEKELEIWTDTICNKRLHGTIKKVPADLFIHSEKKVLKTLPNKRFEILRVEERKVNNYGHVSFKNNFYSVPANYIGQKVILKHTSTLLKIYIDLEQIALHQIETKNGEFITKEEHKPIQKQRKSEQEYIHKSIAFGTETHQFLLKLKEDKPFNWQRMMQGIFSLEKIYSAEILNLACKRANIYNTWSYTSIKNICKNNLYLKEKEDLAVNSDSQVYAQNLKKYDQITNK